MLEGKITQIKGMESDGGSTIFDRVIQKVLSEKIILEKGTELNEDMDHANVSRKKVQERQ